MTGLYLRFHGWRGFSLHNPQRDLFHHVIGLGFVSIYVCRRCLWTAYQKLRGAAMSAVEKSEDRHLDKGGT